MLGSLVYVLWSYPIRGATCLQNVQNLSISYRTKLYRISSIFQPSPHMWLQPSSFCVLISHSLNWSHITSLLSCCESPRAAEERGDGSYQLSRGLLHMHHWRMEELNKISVHLCFTGAVCNLFWQWPTARRSPVSSGISLYMQLQDTERSSEGWRHFYWHDRNKRDRKATEITAKGRGESTDWSQTT